jgi:hypothetical protein
MSIDLTNTVRQRARRTAVRARHFYRKGTRVFSKPNRRFTAVLICIAAVGLHGISKVAYLAEHDKNSATVWGVITFLVVQLLAVLRAVMSDVDAMKDREKIKTSVDNAATAAAIAAEKVEAVEKKTNGNLERAIAQVAEKVQEASNRPSPAQHAMPQDVESLRSFVEDVGRKLAPKLAEEICDDIAVKAARVAAEAVRESERAALIGRPCDHANPPDAIFCSTCGMRRKPNPLITAAMASTTPAPPPKRY